MWPDKKKPMSKEDAIKKIAETPTTNEEKLAGIRRVLRSRNASSPKKIAEEFYPKPPLGW